MNSCIISIQFYIFTPCAFIQLFQAPTTFTQKSKIVWEDKILNSILIPIVNVHGLFHFLYLLFIQTLLLKYPVTDEMKRKRKSKNDSRAEY